MYLQGSYTIKLFFYLVQGMHKMMILVIRRNIDKGSGFPDIVLRDIYYNNKFFCNIFFSPFKEDYSFYVLLK